MKAINFDEKLNLDPDSEEKIVKNSTEILISFFFKQFKLEDAANKTTTAPTTSTTTTTAMAPASVPVIPIAAQRRVLNTNVATGSANGESYLLQ